MKPMSLEMRSINQRKERRNKMAKCKNCNSEDYEIIYIEEYDYNGDYIRVLAKARCCECGKEFWVREYFDFDDSKNV
jgi:YgiT-type zinc finger domain-containing protein